MRGWRRVCAIGLCTALLGGAATARPRDARAAEALRHFTTGTALYSQGRFAEALRAFSAAQAIKPDPVLLFDLAQTHRALGNDEDALTFYRAYVEAAPYAPNREETLGKIRALDEALAKRRTQAAEADAARRVAHDLRLNALALKTQADDAAVLARQAQLRADRLSRSARPLYKQWWFWTVTGILVTGGVAAGAALGRPSPPATDHGNIAF
jgi:tetratricopeptide (TPR) repeat protein